MAEATLSAYAKWRRTLRPSLQASWDRRCQIGDLERSLGSLPVFAGGARAWCRALVKPVKGIAQGSASVARGAGGFGQRLFCGL